MLYLCAMFPCSLFDGKKTEQLKPFIFYEISNVKDEINYLERVIDIKEDAYEKLERLKNLKDEMNEKYEKYTREFKNKR